MPADGVEKTIKDIEPLPEPKLKIRVTESPGQLCPLIPEAQVFRWSHLSRNSCFSPPKTVLSAPPTPHHRSGSGSPSLTRCRAAPRLRRPSGSRLAPPDPEPSVAHLFRTPRLPAPDPAAWSRGRACHIFFSRGRSGARHALPQSHRLEQRAGARAPDARAAQRLPQQQPASAEQPPGAAPETRRSALASRAAGGVCSGADRSVLGGENERGGLGLRAGAVLRSASAARLIVPGGSLLPAPAQSLRRAPPRAPQRPPLAPRPSASEASSGLPSPPRSPSGRQLASGSSATTPHCRAPLPGGCGAKGTRWALPGCEPSPAGGTE